MRSQIVQQWLKQDAGIDYPRITGGYKALRTFLIQTLDDAVAQCDLQVLGGMTGTGKTDVLVQLDNALDLEGHANHRGSSFGKRATGQPSNIDFENRLAIDVLKKRDKGVERFVLEDESRTVGSCALPLALYQTLQTAPMVWLEDSLNSRVERILRDYVIELCAEFVARNGEHGFALFSTVVGKSGQYSKTPRRGALPAFAGGDEQRTEGAGALRLCGFAPGVDRSVAA